MSHLNATAYGAAVQARSSSGFGPIRLYLPLPDARDGRGMIDRKPTASNASLKGIEKNVFG